MLKRVIALIAAGVLLLCGASGLALTAQDAAQLSPDETDEDLLNRYLSAWEEALATDYKLVMVSSYPMVPGMEDFLPQGENIIYVQEGTEAAEYLFAFAERDYLWYDYYMIKVLKEAGFYDGEVPDKDTFAALVEAHYGGDARDDGQLVGEAQTTDDFVGNTQDALDGLAVIDVDMISSPLQPPEASSSSIYQGFYESLLEGFYQTPKEENCLDPDCIVMNGDTLVSVNGWVDSEDLMYTEQSALVFPEIGIRHIGENAIFDIRDGSKIRNAYVWLPEGVESIGSNAFTYQDMRYVYLPPSVTEIAAGAFSHCDFLQGLIIPQGITTLPEAMFYNCSDVRWLVIPENVQEIPDGLICNLEYPEAVSEVVIYGYSGTEAEDFARRNGLIFVDLTSYDVQPNRPAPEGENQETEESEACVHMYAPIENTVVWAQSSANPEKHYTSSWLQRCTLCGNVCHGSGTDSEENWRDHALTETIAMVCRYCNIQERPNAEQGACRRGRVHMFTVPEKTVECTDCGCGYVVREKDTYQKPEDSKPDTQDSEKVSSAEEFNRLHPSIYLRIEKKLGDLNGWSEYREAIYARLLKLSDENLDRFYKLLKKCNYKNTRGCLSFSEGIDYYESDAPATINQDITYNMSRVADSTRQTTIDQYSRWYNRQPTDEELRQAIENGVFYGLIHEMGHAEENFYLLDPIPFAYQDYTRVDSDVDFLNYMRTDMVNNIYRRLRKNTNHKTALRITAYALNCDIGDVKIEDIPSLSAAEEALLEKVLTQICYDGIENYDASYNILDSMSGLLVRQSDRENMAPRARDGYYDVYGFAARNEFWANYFAVMIIGDEEMIDYMEEFCPLTTQYLTDMYWNEGFVE